MSDEKNKNNFAVTRFIIHIFDGIMNKIWAIIVLVIVIFAFNKNDTEVTKLLLDFIGKILQRSYLLTISLILNIVFIFIIIWINKKNDFLISQLKELAKKDSINPPRFLK